MARAQLALLLMLLVAGCGGGGGGGGDNAASGAIAVDGISPKVGIFRVDREGSHVRRLTKGTAHATDVEPEWSPNGRSLAFARCLPGGRCQIYTMDADGSDVREVIGARGYGPAWSPDGKKLAFNAVDGGIATVNADGGGFRTLSSVGSRKPAWSPDGRRIAYATVVDVFVAKADGGGEKSLGVGLSPKSAAAWSPDGRHLAFVDLRDIAKPTLTLVRPNGTGRRALSLPSDLTPQVESDLDWSPDGRSLVFAAVGDRGFGIYVVPISGGRARPLLIGRYGDPSWQPQP
jgi:Tol biopolymer transport system component